VSNDEIKQLKLGDYVKKALPEHSDEYFMVTMIENGYKLRKVGAKSVLDIKDISDFIKVDTRRHD